MTNIPKQKPEERTVEPTIVAEDMITRWLGITTMSFDEQMGQARGGDNSDNRIADDTITFRASVESVDRAGDVIRADGWELENYRRNPVVLWAHRHDLLPIGRSVDIWVENDSLFATIEFAKTDFAQEILNLFRDGFLRGVSVGFRALKTSASNGKSSSGTIFERQELLEISAAPVPMHPGALATGEDQAKVDDSEQRELLPLFRQLTEIWRSIAAVSK